MDTDYTMKLHKKVHNQELDLRGPQISSFYKPIVQQKQGEMIYVGEMTLALRLAASRFLWTIIKWKENFQGFIIVLKAFWRDCQLWRNWLKKPEFLRTLQSTQSFGWWNRPSGRYICWLRSISRDQRFNLNVQMQFIKLIFFSILMKRRPQGRRKSINTHWQLLQADSKLPNLSPQKASSKVTGFSDNLWPWTTEVEFFKLILGAKSWVKRECERSQRSGNRWAIQSNFGWMLPHFPIYVKRWKRVRDQLQISCGLWRSSISIEHLSIRMSLFSTIWKMDQSVVSSERSFRLVLLELSCLRKKFVDLKKTNKKRVSQQILAILMNQFKELVKILPKSLNY